MIWNTIIKKVNLNHILKFKLFVSITQDINLLFIVYIIYIDNFIIILKI